MSASETPRTDEIYTEDSPNGYPHPMDAIELARTLERELGDLAAWKRQAMAVLAECDVQAVGKLLDLPLGSAIYRQIEPGIRALQTKLYVARAALQDIADQNEYLTVAIAEQALGNTKP